MAEDENQEGAGESKDGSKKKKLIMIIAAAVVLLLVGVGAMFFLMGGSSHETPEATEADSSHGESKPAEDHKAEEHKEGEKPKDEGEKPAAEGGAAQPAASTPQSEVVDISFGETYTMKPFHINLGNPLENRYVRLELAFEFRNGKEQRQELEARLPQLRDAVISVASKKTREFLLGPDGKDQLRLEILNRVNQYMDRKIESVYIMDILIE